MEDYRNLKSRYNLRRRLKKYIELHDSCVSDGRLNLVQLFEQLVIMDSPKIDALPILEQLPEWRRARETGIFPRLEDIGGAINSFKKTAPPRDQDPPPTSTV